MEIIRCPQYEGPIIVEEKTIPLETIPTLA